VIYYEVERILQKEESIQGKEEEEMKVWSATWCVPCKQVKAWLARNPDVSVQLMDVDKDKPPSDIRTVPTLETDSSFVGQVK
jgi:glutaredoxin